MSTSQFIGLFANKAVCFDLHKISGLHGFVLIRSKKESLENSFNHLPQMFYKKNQFRKYIIINIKIGGDGGS